MTTITARRQTTPGTGRQSHVVADAVTMLRRNLLHMVRYPGLSVFTIVGPVVLLLLFVFVFGGTLGAGLPGVGPGRRAGGVPRLRHAGHPAADHRRQRRRHRDDGLDGHDRGHHRAVPHHGDLAGRGARRARARQHHPGDHRRRAGARRRPADRLPPDRRTGRVARRRRPARAHRVRDQLARGRPWACRRSRSRRRATCPCC